MLSRQTLKNLGEAEATQKQRQNSPMIARLVKSVLYRLMRKKYDSSELQIFSNEMFKKIFYFLSAFYPILWLIDITK